LEIPGISLRLFYRRLLEVTRYFQPGPGRRDPFQEQKRKQIEADIARLAGIWEEFPSLDAKALFRGVVALLPVDVALI
jgi:hypothetical protein